MKKPLFKDPNVNEFWLTIGTFVIPIFLMVAITMMNYGARIKPTVWENHSEITDSTLRDTIVISK